MKKSNALKSLACQLGTQSFVSSPLRRKEQMPLSFSTAKRGRFNLQVALLLLRQCGGFCWMVHIARCTPPSVALEGLQLPDEEVLQTFSDSMCTDPSDLVWKQAQLSLSRGGLWLCSASLHSTAAHSCLPF